MDIKDETLLALQKEHRTISNQLDFMTTQLDFMTTHLDKREKWKDAYIHELSDLKTAIERTESRIQWMNDILVTKIFIFSFSGIGVFEFIKWIISLF